MGSGDEILQDKTSSQKKFILLHLMCKVSPMMSRQKCVDGSFRKYHQERQGNLKSNLSC